MHIIKCDICKKVISSSQKAVGAGIGWKSSELCFDCGAPIIKFLLQKNLVSKEDVNKLQT